MFSHTPCFVCYDGTLGYQTAFVNAPLDENIFVYPVPGFETYPGEVYRLRKALYGTCLAKISGTHGGVPHLKDECVFIFKDSTSGGWLYLLFPLFNEKGKAIRDKIFSLFLKKSQWKQKE